MPTTLERAGGAIGGAIPSVWTAGAAATGAGTTAGGALGAASRPGGAEEQPAGDDQAVEPEQDDLGEDRVDQSRQLEHRDVVLLAVELHQLVEEERQDAERLEIADRPGGAQDP